MSGQNAHGTDTCDTDRGVAERARTLADALAASLDTLFDHIETTRRIPEQELQRLTEIVAGWNDTVAQLDVAARPAGVTAL
ncbi:hypothetical protein M1M07_17325 [Rhodococcus sp. HM1]|uniref:hypothetical protein n=1 Tax=unclassified Rhodococcus (in: high G+C Gram-positive bacteria) TaxID=192944 RepID=UPI0018CFD4B9|nr:MULTISPECIES: hypothetical protein [unclassified Rhodococcus (in: high G+C Gram-positive bacteria)]MBH0122603.1 hypothetical protein [Rhodococcus sp. CX]MCK8672859.1 hypothetical protein [Rhodococcus sp. HM1]